MTVNTPKASLKLDDKGPKTAQPGPRKKNKSLLMTPGGDRHTSPDDRFYQTTKKPQTAENNSILLSSRGNHRRNMTGTKFMGSTHDSNFYKQSKNVRSIGTRSTAATSSQI